MERSVASPDRPLIARRGSAVDQALLGQVPCPVHRCSGMH